MKKPGAFLKLVRSFFTYKYITFSTPLGYASYRISKTSFVLLFFILICSFCFTTYSITNFIIKKIAIDKVYVELVELRSANSALIKYVDDVSSELDSFSGYIGNSTKLDSNPKKARNAVHVAKSKIIRTNNSIASFFIALNERVASVVRQINSTGLHSSSFVANKETADLEKIKLISTREFKADASPISKYDYAKKYYYFRSDLLDSLYLHFSNTEGDSTGLSFATVKAPMKRQNADHNDRKIGVLQKLESVLSSIPFGSPLRARHRVSSKYGHRIDPFSGHARMHHGVDLVGKHGDKVFSTAPGRVILSSAFSCYGKTVDIDHGHGIVTRYAHLDKIFVKSGQKVTVQDVIGIQGNSGKRTTGSHLHYELRYANKPINPINFVMARRTPIVGDTALAALATSSRNKQQEKINVA